MRSDLLDYPEHLIEHLRLILRSRPHGMSTVSRSSLSLPVDEGPFGGRRTVPRSESPRGRIVTYATCHGEEVFRVVLFVILSGVLAHASRASLKAPRSHGFYRFFAWECILVLFFLNFIDLRHWFADPFSFRQTVSWILLTGCVFPAAYGVIALRTRGKPDARRPHDVPLFRIEKTTRLVTNGAFKYIRHPLYSSLLLLAWGVFFKQPSWVAGGAVLAATAFLLATAKAEEAENLAYFGAAYRTYMQRTKMFIPFLF